MYVKESLNLFEDFIDFTIISVYRKFYDAFDLSNQELCQEKDGSLVLLFSNGKRVSFYPFTENFTILIEIDENIDFSNLTDLTNNSFWKRYKGLKVKKVLENIEFNIENPSGLRFIFEDNSFIKIIYVSEGLYSFDALIIRNH